MCAFVPDDFPAEDARPFELRHRLVFRTARRTDSQVGQAKEHIRFRKHRSPEQGDTALLTADFSAVGGIEGTRQKSVFGHHPEQSL